MYLVHSLSLTKILIIYLWWALVSINLYMHITFYLYIVDEYSITVSLFLRKTMLPIFIELVQFDYSNCFCFWFYIVMPKKVFPASFYADLKKKKITDLFLISPNHWTCVYLQLFHTSLSSNHILSFQPSATSTLKKGQKSSLPIPVLSKVH